MDRETKKYIDGLDIGSIPWNRMFTAYGTAENYAGLLQELGEIRDLGQWKKTFSRISDFEHQSTMFPPAPFALVFLVRILRKLIEDGDADDIAAKLIDQFTYYADVCSDAEEMEHAEPLGSFEDLLDDGNLLPEDPTEDDLMAVYEDPDAVPPELFYSFYYFSKMVLSLVPDILDACGRFPAESRELRKKTEGASDA